MWTKSTRTDCQQQHMQDRELCCSNLSKPFLNKKNIHKGVPQRFAATILCKIEKLRVLLLP